MTHVWAEGYDLNDLIRVRVSAWNWVGMSDYSEANEEGALTRTVPLKPAEPFEGEHTNEAQIQVDWVHVTDDDTGRSDILSYILFWDMGDDTAASPMTELANEYKLSHNVSDLTPGPYRFMVRAVNVYGAGEWSDVATIMASYVPDVVPIMNVTLNYPTFDFTWHEPHTGTETIDAYEILIYHPVDTVYIEDKTVCDGADPTTRDNRICQVPVDHLLTEFGYTYGSLPKVMARAHNINGWGDFSSPNLISQDDPDGVTDPDGTLAHLIEGVPTWAPQPYEGASTTFENIHVEWTEIELNRTYPIAYVNETGNSYIVGYVLEWDKATG